MSSTDLKKKILKKFQSGSGVFLKKISEKFFKVQTCGAKCKKNKFQVVNKKFTSPK
jgi:hypothetical protein